MKEKSKSEVSIIGGADGPTSIFIAGRTRKKPLKVRIRNIIYRYRRKIVEKKVVADSHTLDELVQYAMNTYNLIETNSTERKYIEQQKNLKESLILQHKPELLGQRKDIPKPDFHNEESVKNFLNEMEIRNKLIDTFIFHKCPLLTNRDYIGDSQSFSQNRSSITVTAILYFTSISIFSGGLAKSLSISFSSTPAIFAIVSLDMP